MMKRPRVSTLSRVPPERSRKSSHSRRPRAPSLHYLGPKADLDLRRGVYLLAQVLRHALSEGLPSDEERHTAGVAGEMERGLSGRITSPDDVSILARESLRFGQRSPVEDAGARKALNRRQPRASIRDTVREDN